MYFKEGQKLAFLLKNSLALLGLQKPELALALHNLILSSLVTL